MRDVQKRLMLESGGPELTLDARLPWIAPRELLVSADLVSMYFDIVSKK